MWINLEDIWSYRSNLSIQEKSNIVIPSAKQPFHDFNKSLYFYYNKEKLQKYLLQDINILISSGIDNSYSNIGCLYVLTALSSVSYECLNSMSWLQQTF